jgi:hypothetical protein
MIQRFTSHKQLKFSVQVKVGCGKEGNVEGCQPTTILQLLDLTLHWIGGRWQDVEIQYYLKTFFLFVSFLIIYTYMELPRITNM